MKDYARLIRRNKEFYSKEFALNLINQFKQDTIRVGFAIIMLKEFEGTKKSRH